jgi:hypothetical protein
MVGGPGKRFHTPRHRIAMTMPVNNVAFKKKYNNVKSIEKK